MKRSYILLYHVVFWIYRVIHILTFNYIVHKLAWYDGAYVVQLVLMPFFYLNYSWLIPTLLKKQYKKYAVLTLAWIALFIAVYSQWTIYQLHLLYGWEISPPNYIETVDNLIYIWLISSSFCLFEFWIANLEKNRAMAVERKKHLLKAEENKMLNHLLSEYLNALEQKELQDLPDKILMVSDFFKYNLYSLDKVVSIKSEMEYVQIFEELKNSNGSRIHIHNHLRDVQLLIPATSIVAILNKLILLLDEKREINILLETIDLGNVIILDNNSYYTPAQLELLKTEFKGYQEYERFVIPFKGNLVQS